MENLPCYLLVLRSGLNFRPQCLTQYHGTIIIFCIVLIWQYKIDMLFRTGSESNTKGIGGYFTPGYNWRYKLEDILTLEDSL